MVMYHSDKLEGHIYRVNVMDRWISSPTGEEDTDPFRPDGDYWIDGSPFRSSEELSRILLQCVNLTDVKSVKFQFLKINFW